MDLNFTNSSEFWVSTSQIRQNYGPQPHKFVRIMGFNFTNSSELWASTSQIRPNLVNPREKLERQVGYIQRGNREAKIKNNKNSQKKIIKIKSLQIS